MGIKKGIFFLLLGMYLISLDASGKVASTTFRPGEVVPEVKSTLVSNWNSKKLSTGDNEIQEILFGDGAAVTLGANTSVELVQETETLRIKLHKGSIKVVAGSFSADKAVLVEASKSTIQISNAAAMIIAKPSGELKSQLIFGESLTVSNASGSKTINRPGFAVLDAPAVPGVVSLKSYRESKESIVEDLGQIHTAKLVGFSATELASLDVGNEENDSSSESVVFAVNEDQNGTVSEITDTNTDTGDTGQSDLIIPGRIGSVVSIGSDGFGPGAGTEAPDVSANQPSQSDDDRFILVQDRYFSSEFDETNFEDHYTYQEKAYSRTSNTLFTGIGKFTQATTENKPNYIADNLPGYNEEGKAPTPGVFSNKLAYYFLFDYRHIGFVIEDLSYVGAMDFLYSVQTNAPFSMENLEENFPLSGEVYQRDIVNFEAFSDFGLDVGSRGGYGSIFPYASSFKLLQAGFNNVATGSNDNYIVERSADNFIALEVLPASILRDQLRENYSKLLDQEGYNEIEAAEFNLALNQPIVNFDPENPDHRAAILLLAENILQEDSLKPEAFLFELVGDIETNTLLAETFPPGEYAYPNQKLIDLVSNLYDIVDSPDKSRAEQYFFATGDLDGRLADDFEDRGFSVDVFYISAGLNNYSNRYSTSIGDEIRAFARLETALGLELYDSGLLIVNGLSSNENTQSALLHVDFAMEGGQADQQSTVSLTIANLEYIVRSENDYENYPEDYVPEPNLDSVDALVTGKTIGSSLGKTEAQVDLVSFQSPIRATAAGGGNPDLDHQGYAGYFVFENYNPPDPNDDAGLTINGDSPIYGGTETPIGNVPASQDYAYLRLATSTGEIYVDENSRSSGVLEGWAAALETTDRQEVVNVTQFDTDDSPENFKIEFDHELNRVSVRLDAYGFATPILMGGLDGEASKGASAYVDNQHYAARTIDDNTGQSLGLVSSTMVAEGLPSEITSYTRDYSYLQWGFFFGDTRVTETERDHVHLGTWVAGDLSNLEELDKLADLPSTSGATYTGHAIGNVNNGSASYTAAGSFSNTWDFAHRTGTVAMSFDNTTYTGQTALIDDSVVFVGRIDAGTVAREGALHGNFIQSATDPAAGVIGRFSIANTVEGDTYRASGTFAAEK